MKTMKIFLANFILVLFTSALFIMNSCEKKEPDPFACFTVSSTLIDVGEVITTSNCSNNAFSYLWDDGEGNNSILPEPSFYYNEPGNYIVTLTAYSQSGNKQNTTQETITVEVVCSGEFMLSSELLQSGQTYFYYGFTFKYGQIFIFPNDSVQLDLAATYNNFNQDITLQSSNQVDAFHKNGTFLNAADAEAYFNNYYEVTAEGFQPWADNIEVNQVWTVQTNAKKFAKIWIKDSQIKTGTISDYVELTIKYQYQPDGSKIFTD